MKDKCDNKFNKFDLFKTTSLIALANAFSKCIHMYTRTCIYFVMVLMNDFLWKIVSGILHIHSHTHTFTIIAKRFQTRKLRIKLNLEI